MASAVVPSTPATQTTYAAGAPPSPGTWRHPKFDEIARRQNATTFNDKNVQKITWNGSALLASWIVANTIESYPKIYNHIVPLGARDYAEYSVLIIRLLLLLNIVLAFLPLLKKKDDLTDIPLTPSQRALLGLDPSVSAPVTPGSQYITPPRYPRSTTPRSGTPGSRNSSNAGSPLSRKGISTLGRQPNDSPFSPSASPLWQKAIGGSRDTSRRHSYGSSSPLGIGFNGKESSVLGAPHTPSPSAGRGASVGLSNRWLYERGRGSPGNRSVYS